MKIVACYIWGKTEHGYGWNLWEGRGLSMKREDTTGYWRVYEPSGELFCRCVSYTDAQKVVARVRQLTLAQVTPSALPNFAYVGEGKAGWVVHTVDIHEDFGETFRSREDAEAYLMGRELRARQ
jgi:hypothetical protein